MLIAAAFLVVVAGTAALIYLTPLRHIDVVAPSMHEIDPQTLYADMAKNPDEYLFIDVRDASVYNAAHAKGAINIPIAYLTTQHYLLPKTGKQIALICTTGQLATIAYGYLEDWGFRNLLHVTGGLQNWSLEKLPIEGTAVIDGVDTAPMTPDGASST
jgi:hydroxyacylglutathione hydrolase